jgi:hypothetical protein
VDEAAEVESGATGFGGSQEAADAAAKEGCLREVGLAGGGGEEEDGRGVG